MLSLKLIDRIALAAMLAVAGAIPLAASAFTLGADPAQRQANVLNDDTFNGIRPGMTEREVLERIGAPHRKMRFEATRTTAWDYRYRDTWGYNAEFSVMLDDSGTVVGKFSTREGD